MVAPARWFVVLDGERRGPLELAEVRRHVVAGSVTDSTWVWADGMPEWRRAGDVPALVPPRELGVEGWSSGSEPAGSGEERSP